MTKTECLAQINLLGINCTDTYGVSNTELAGDIFVLNQNDATHGAGYLSYSDHQGIIQSTMFLKYEDMVTRALIMAHEKKNG